MIETSKESKAKAERHPMLIVLKNRNLRLMWIGEGLSVLGSQFYLIALPWLVLQMTGDPFKMGAVLALAGIPRALFILIGGALTDRFSPKRLIIYSNVVRMGVGILLTVLVLNGWVTILALYALSLIFGLADAFLFPAQNAMLPLIVDQEHLLAGNAIVQGTAHLSVAVGPALAGIIIAIFSGQSGVEAAGTQTADYFGIAVSFSINATAFFLSIIAFSFVQPKLRNATDEKSDVFSLLKQGFDHVRGNRTLIYMLITSSVGYFLVEGPLLIGIPVLAHSRYPQGAAAFGIIMSGLGAGMLIGIIAAGTLRKLKPERMGQVLLGLLGVSGFFLMSIGFIASAYVAAVVVMLMGLAQGYVVVQISTWFQIQTPDHMLGRVLSMMMFASLGLVPVSQALCGALIKLSHTGLFIGSGIALSLFSLMMMFTREIKNMGLVMEKQNRSKQS
jgi:MFS family permease